MKRLIISFLLSSFILPVISQEDYVDELVRKGIELRERGCFEDAVKYYQKNLSIYPESMAIYFEMAYNYACMNEIEKSFEYAEKAMIADDRSQEFMYVWMFIISAYENAKLKTTHKEKTDFEQLPVRRTKIKKQPDIF